MLRFGASYAASIGFTVLLLSKTHSPELWLARWRRRRARRHLAVVKDKRDEPPRWIN